MILDFGDGFYLRRATTHDHTAFCEVCLRTGDAGEDATSREDDPQLMGMIYAVPYQVLEPEFAFAIAGTEGVAGYLFGVPDTRAFNSRLAAEWYARLQARVADPGPDRSKWRGSDWARHVIHHPYLAVPEALKPYPSHGHIDLLAEARGRGVGRLCMEYLQRRLIEAGSTGMYLDVHPRNTRAQAFYRGLGFQVVAGRGLPGTSIFMTKSFA
jgi:ribosomal protein S18 acetylase RimI-like enzyme